jgi:DNA-directed RNA polymerase I subunit RPA2
MPDGSGPSKRTPTFNTLAREHAFKYPPKDGSTYSILNEFVTPHIESFNALFDDSGLPQGDGDGRGLISLGLKDIGERVVFGRSTEENKWGNRMRSVSFVQLPCSYQFK